MMIFAWIPWRYSGKEPTSQCRKQGEEDLLQEEMATRSSSLAWRIPWTEEPVSVDRLPDRQTVDRLPLQSTGEGGSQKVRQTE